MQRRFYAVWRLAIALSVGAALFVTLFIACSSAPAGMSDAAERTDADPIPAETAETVEAARMDEPAPEPTPSPEPTPPPVELGLTEDRGEGYLAQCVFLGDSTTYGLATYGVLPFTQVWVPENGTLTLSNQSFTNIDYYEEDGTVTSLSIADAAARKKPAYLIITLGLNGISFMGEESFKTEYIDLIRSIQEASPETRIICHSIYPVIDSLVSSDISNDRINRANGWIYDVAAETGTRYLNTHDALTDASGQLDAAYNTTALDGIHLNTEGFQVVTNSVRTHGYQ